MRKKLLFTLSSSLLCLYVNSQDLLGLGTGNYSGITGMTINPASIVDNRLKFDLNIIGISSYYTNNYLSVKRDALINGSFFKSRYQDWSLVQKELLEENSLGPNEKVNARLNTRVMVPLSFMATINEKSSVALTINNRTGVMMNNVNQDFARLFYNNFNDPTLFNKPISLNGISTDILNWIDIGFTYGRVLVDKKEHFLKAAFTAKYIGGVASGYLESNDMWIDFSGKDQFQASSAYTQYGHSNKLSMDMFKSATIRSLRPEAEAFGWNAGLVYEYRGNIDKFKYLTPENTERNRRDVNKYAFRLGVSIMDAGRLQFDKGGYNNDFSAAISNWNLQHYNIKKIQDVDNMLADHVNYVTTGKGSYTVSLPTALSVQLDLHLAKGFYLNALTYQPVKLVTADRYMRIEPVYAVTPRFESRVFGLYLPVTYNQFDKWNLGATLRLGPIYLGSANLASLVFNDKVKTADIHAGVRIPIAQGRPNKLARFYDKLKSTTKDTTSPSTIQLARADSTEQARQMQIQILQTRLLELEKQRIIDSMRLLLQAQSPATPPAPVNIFINNYAGANGEKSISVDSMINIANKSALNANRNNGRDSTAKSAPATPLKQQQLRKTDSLIIKRDTVTKTDTIYATQPTSFVNIVPSERLTASTKVGDRPLVEDATPGTFTKSERQTNNARQTPPVENAVIAMNNNQNRANYLQDSLNRVQQALVNARMRETNEQLEQQRRNMQRDLERQQRQIRDMESEMRRLRNQASRTNQTMYNNNRQPYLVAAPTTTSDSLRYPTDSLEQSGKTKSKKFRPFAFLSKKKTEESTDSITELQTAGIDSAKPHKKFQPFAFLHKKNTVAENNSTVTTATDEKKKFRPFAFLKKKPATTIDSSARDKTASEHKKFRPFAFLKKKPKEEARADKTPAAATQPAEKKKWNPFRFLQKKKEEKEDN